MPLKKNVIECWIKMAFFTFFKATFEGWIEVMAHASDAVGEDQQPIRDQSRSFLVFFIIFNLVGSFFILNLIVGVIIESFQKLRKQVQS